MRTLELKIPPPVVLVLTAAIMWLLARVTPWLTFYIPAFNLIAAVLGVLGVATSLTGVRAFRRANTTVNPMKPETTSALVTTGIYQRTRNPMYVGLSIALLGWAVFLSNVTAFALVPLFVLYLTRFQVIPEERALAAAFADEFGAYRSRVRRWL